MTRLDPVRTSPSADIVPDERTAILIGEAVVDAKFGVNTRKSEQPFKATLSNGTWEVRGSLPWLFKKAGGIGGVAVVKINKQDGRIVDYYHGK